MGSAGGPVQCPSHRLLHSVGQSLLHLPDHPAHDLAGTGLCLLRHDPAKAGQSGDKMHVGLHSLKHLGLQQ